LVLHGAADTVNHPKTSEGKEQFFRNTYQRLLLPGVGHFPQRENATEVAKALIQFLSAPSA
jgi:pimeloyl-ACP methyl ester carboxylesterase